MLGGVALAPAPRPDLRRGALRRARQFRVPRGGPALRGGRPPEAGLHRALGRARAPAGRRGRARPRPPGAGPTARALAPPPGMGDAVGGDGEALRVALSSDGGPHQRAARRSRDQLARRPAAGAPGGHPPRPVAQHALRRAPLLRAPAHDSRGALRGGPGGRRRPAGDTRPRHAAAARSHRAAGAPLPDARRAARLRHDVRAHRRRPGGDHRDAHGLRLPEPLPDAPARLRLGDQRRRLCARHGRRVGLPPAAPPARGRGVRRPARTAVDLLVLVALAAYAAPFFWQLLTSLKPEGELLRVPPLLPSRLTLAHYRVVLEQSLIPRALVNSVGIATLTTLLRSEEHTSELQSRLHLVCRLLLEKKKK